MCPLKCVARYVTVRLGTGEYPNNYPAHHQHTVTNCLVNEVVLLMRLGRVAELCLGTTKGVHNNSQDI